MKYRRLGRTDMNVSVVGFGTWAIGGADWGKVHDSDSIKAIHRGIDLGINLFDTAPLYGNGRSEEVLGRALEGIRDEVIIATKCGPREVRPGLLHVDLSRQGIIQQCEDSLRRLKTDRIDLLQVHWFDPAWPIEDTMGHLGDLVQSGKVRYIGVSNYGLAELNRAAKTGSLSSLQPPYNLFIRDIEGEILPFCQGENIGVLAYEPLARGLLTAKFQDKPIFEPGDIRASDPRFSPSKIEAYVRSANRIQKIAQNNEMTAAQCAIAWILCKPVVTSALCGAKTAAQAVENARAADFVFDPVTIQRLEEASNLTG